MEYIFGALVVLVIFTSTVYSQSNGNTSSVQLLVNYESLCPDSINFFNNHLNQAVKQFGSQLEVKLIPWGIANYTWDSTNKMWVFTCQHGESECLGNKIHNCMMYHYPETHYDYVSCTIARFNKTDMLAAVQTCAGLYSSLDAKLVGDCAKSAQGTQLTLGMGVYSKLVQKDLNWVPWIVVNGQHTEEIQDSAEQSLISHLCQYNLPACSI